LNARPLHLITKQILNVIVVCLLADAFAQQSADAGSKTDPISGIEKVGGRVSAPRLVYAPDPEYSAEALDAKYEGFCVLSVVVGSDGLPRDIKIVQELGHGLDEKAVEAVKEWKFEPAMKDGQPVAVQTYVQVQFQRHELFDSDPQEHLVKDVAQSNKISPYTPEQLAKLHAKCAPYMNTTIDELESQRIPLPHECVEVLEGMRRMRKQQLEQLANAAAQANKMPQYTQEQLADLRAKCAPYINTKLEDLERKKAPLPPHECREVLEWMRNPRVDALYTSEKPPQ
jgi:TonB family protein